MTIAPELHACIDAVAAHSYRSPAEVVADALEHGHSLDWQERFIERFDAGMADAEAGRFTTPVDFERLRNKYRPT